MLYHKSLRLGVDVRNARGVGTVVNLQSNDASKVWMMPVHIHTLWNSPFQVTAMSLCRSGLPFSCLSASATSPTLACCHLPTGASIKWKTPCAFILFKTPPSRYINFQVTICQSVLSCVCQSYVMAAHCLPGQLPIASLVSCHANRQHQDDAVLSIAWDNQP